MSKGNKINLDKAKEISQEWIDKLSPYCLEISNAGTVRREDRESTNDIDIVLIRDENKFDEFKAVLEDLEYISGQPDGKSCRRELSDGICLDLRMCSESNWGWILLKHTGPTSFYIFADEEIDDDIGREFETEKEVFEKLGMEYIEPKYRNILDSETIEKLRGQFFIGNTPQQTKLEILQEPKMNWLNKMKQKKQIGVVDFKVIQDAKEKIGQLSIRGSIGETFFEEGVTDTSVAKALKEIGTVDTLEVLINSGGGSVFDAFSIFTQLRKFNAKIITSIEGLAASAAAFIHQAGDEREMSGNALFMIHESSGFASGKKDMMEKMRLLLAKIDKVLETTFKRTSNQNLTELRQLMVAETFLTAEEALEKGFIDRITDDSDEEPHVQPDDKIQDNTLEEIYKRHAKLFTDDEQGFKALSELVENESKPDKFSTLPYAPSGDIDNPSLLNLPFIDDGVININGLRYFKARLPLIALPGTPIELEQKRAALEEVIAKAEKQFDVEKAAGKYKDDKLPSSILLNVVIAGKTQTFVQTQKEIQMNTLIMNALGVTDEKEVLGEIAKLKASGLASNVAASGQTSNPDALAAIQVQLTQILNQNTILMEENKRLGSGKDSAMTKLEEVIQFNNKGLLAKRRETLNELFDPKHKINPVQLAKAIKDFVNIEPKDVPETEDLYQFSIKFYETNEVIDGMETTTGLNPDGNPVLSESAVDKFDAEVDKVLKEKGWNAENEGDFNKAIDIVTAAQPKLAKAYADESAPVSSN